MAITTAVSIGQSGETWRDTINSNFNGVTLYMSNETLSLTTAQMNALPSDYKALGKRVFDTTTNQLKRWNGSTWVVIPDVTVGASQPIDGIWLHEG